jgi:2',3'-cyclic-nucleotide 2'-phosphodiesterase (5'-nucleotidase family)
MYKNKNRFKKFTILHSNDMHGDFLSEVLKVRKEI